jgi:hypothetical protein
MRTFAATAAFLCAQADETSLMQDLVTRSSSGKLEAKSSRQDASSKLLETAVNMVKNGVTPDVITFVDATNTDINESVLAAIIREHDKDQNFINDICAQFTAAVQLLEDQMADITSHADNSAMTQVAHHECRAREAKACAYSRRCEAQLVEKWSIVKTEERIMRGFHADIEGGWCVTSKEDATYGEYGSWHDWQATTEWLSRPFDSAFWAETWEYPILDMPQGVRDFRTTSITWFEQYTRQKEVVEEAWRVYNAKVQECSGLERDWELESPECDRLQAESAVHSCEHSQTTRRARQQFGSRWANLIWEMDEARRSKTLNEQDRKSEWETLKIVQCLLDHVHSKVIESIETGAPCPTIESDEQSVTLTIEDCHVVTRGCDEDSMTAHLCLEWCDLPEVPPLPPVEEPACTPTYIAWEQAQFMTEVQTWYNNELSFTEAFDLDGQQYGPYPDEPLTQYFTALSEAGWAGCAPPLVCLDCPDAAPAEPCGGMTERARQCQVHETYLPAGKGNADTFRCLDDTCISQAGRCNGVNNCGDNSDEQNCGHPLDYLGKEFTTPADFHADVHFTCANGNVIDKVGLCNGFNNCDDGSDENECHGNAAEHVQIEASSGRHTSVESLQMDTGAFYDRSYEFDSLGQFAGKTFIKYSNDDKMIDEHHVMIKIRTTKPVTVYVVQVHDHTLNWLGREGYSQSNLEGPSFRGIRETRHKEWDERLLEEDVFKATQVFSKVFPAGTISIPGNAVAGDAGSTSEFGGTDGSFLVFVE